ncbi:MAG: ABC transporter substrate-binding protein [Chloroflexota bacterium]
MWLPALMVGVSLACNYRPAQPEAQPTTVVVEPAPAGTAVGAAPPAGDRLLTVCMGQEPGSLFLYGDQSAAARSVRQAIYDGPFDVVNYTYQPVILEAMPTLENGGLALAPVELAFGQALVDVNGRVTSLSEGVSYLPAGCAEPGCAQVYSGQAPVQMDQLAVTFKLRSGITWSDGAPLTAADSVYSYDVARALYPIARAELLDRTQSYQALDDQTVEWRGLPGYRVSAAPSFFFTPLPQHAWGSSAPRDLLTAENAARKPLGWGAYVIDEWTPGDHIALSRSPAYFRSSEGLPAFEKLVFRFMPDRAQALDALLAGECDVLDESLHLEQDGARMLELAQAGKAALAWQVSSAWEHLDFNLLPALAPDGSAPPALFGARALRQALAQCIDRQKLADELAFGLAQPPSSYAPQGHPALDPGLKTYAFDPQAGGAQLDGLGWKDSDGNPATPRLAQGAAGAADGTPLEFALLTTDEPEKQRAAAILQESLAQCGVKLNLDIRPYEVAFAAGPTGPLFGRTFSTAQFGWVAPVDPPCGLYTTAEIPGPYPQYPRGWGGANAAGYSSPEFDRLCRQAQLALPGSDAYRQAHAAAQAVFAEDLPALPLYARLKLAAARPDFCSLGTVPAAENYLYNLESLSYGDGCAP